MADAVDRAQAELERAIAAGSGAWELLEVIPGG